MPNATQPSVLNADLLAAHDAGSVRVASIAELFEPNGVSLPLANDIILVLIPPSPSRASKLGPKTAPIISTGPGGERVVEWEAGEHTYLGDHVLLQFDGGTQGAASDLPLFLDNGLKLTYGQVVSLGGDFYGPPDPISDDPQPPARFIQAYQSLAVTPGSVAEAQAILKVMQDEINAVNQAINNGQQPSKAYAALGDTLSGEWNQITGGGKLIAPWIPPGRYLNLAKTNWDHFGQNAINCYTEGHGVAVAAAIAAAAISDQGERTTHLQRAYAMNAFADHFLTDIFSSGHMRTPRKALYETVTPSGIGSLLSRFMHDEDCAYGLNVQTQQGTTWLAYGDKRLLDTVNQANLAVVQSAIQASVDEIWLAYSNQSAPAIYAALAYVADLGKVADPESPSNPVPLFYAADGTTYRRTDIEDPTNRKFINNWYGWSTLGMLKASPRFKALGDEEIPFALNTDVLQVFMDAGYIGEYEYSFPLLLTGQQVYGAGEITTDAMMVSLAADFGGAGQTQFVAATVQSLPRLDLYEPTTVSGFASTWDMSLSFFPTTLLAVNVNGDNTRQLLLLNPGAQPGPIEALLLVPAPAGTPGFVQSWSGQLQGQVQGQASNLFLCVDKVGQGAGTNIVLFYNSYGPLAMNVYAPDLSGTGFKTAWSSQNLGTQFSGTFLAVNPNGTGRNAILQLANMNNILTMDIYLPGSDGASYYHAWNGPNMGSCSLFVQWFPVLTGIDEIERVLLVYRNDGAVAMNLYAPTADGAAYTTAWSSTNLGPGSQSGDQWLAINAGPNGDTAIIQFTPGGGGTIVYTFNPATGGFRVTGNSPSPSFPLDPNWIPQACFAVDSALPILPPE